MILINYEVFYSFENVLHLWKLLWRLQSDSADREVSSWLVMPFEDLCVYNWDRYGRSKNSKAYNYKERLFWPIVGRFFWNWGGVKSWSIFCINLGNIMHDRKYIFELCFNYIGFFVRIDSFILYLYKSKKFIDYMIEFFKNNLYDK